MPQFENYFLSFILLGLFWTRHQFQFKHIKNADRTLLWINIIFLSLVTLLPFTTGLLMKYTSHKLPMFLYCVNLAMAALVLSLHWTYAARHKLIDPSLTGESLKHYDRIVYVMPSIFTLCAAASFISARFSLTLLYILPVIFLIYAKIQRKKISEV